MTVKSDAPAPAGASFGTPVPSVASSEAPCAPGGPEAPPPQSEGEGQGAGRLDSAGAAAALPAQTESGDLPALPAFPDVAAIRALVHALANSSGVILSNWFLISSHIDAHPHAAEIRADIEKATTLLVDQLNAIRALLTPPRPKRKKAQKPG